jgi:WD40 repeat protein
VGYSDFAVRIFALPALDLMQQLQAHTNSVFGVDYAPDANRLASAGRDGMLNIWNLHPQPALVHDIPAHTRQITSVSYNSKGTILVTSSMDKTMRLWDAQSMSLLKVIDNDRNAGHQSCVNKILWIADDAFLSCSDDRLVMLWKLEER